MSSDARPVEPNSSPNNGIDSDKGSLNACVSSKMSGSKGAPKDSIPIVMGVVLHSISSGGALWDVVSSAVSESHEPNHSSISFAARRLVPGLLLPVGNGGLAHSSSFMEVSSREDVPTGISVVGDRSSK